MSSIYEQLKRARDEDRPVVLHWADRPSRAAYPCSFTCKVVDLGLTEATLRYGVLDSASPTTSTYMQVEAVVPYDAITAVAVCFPELPRLSAYGEEIV